MILLLILIHIVVNVVVDIVVNVDITVDIDVDIEAGSKSRIALVDVHVNINIVESVIVDIAVNIDIAIILILTLILVLLLILILLLISILLLILILLSMLIFRVGEEESAQAGTEVTLTKIHLRRRAGLLGFPYSQEGVSREVSSKNTIDKRTTCSAPTDSYLPAADDYDYQEDSLAGYDPSQVGPSRVFSQPI